MSGTYGSLLIMNKLLTEKRFSEVIDVFEGQMSDYSLTKSFSLSAPIIVRQSIPYDHLECVVEAMLNLVTVLFSK